MQHVFGIFGKQKTSGQIQYYQLSKTKITDETLGKLSTYLLGNDANDFFIKIRQKKWFFFINCEMSFGKNKFVEKRILYKCVPP